MAQHIEPLEMTEYMIGLMEYTSKKLEGRQLVDVFGAYYGKVSIEIAWQDGHQVVYGYGRTLKEVK